MYFMGLAFMPQSSLLCDCGRSREYKFVAHYSRSRGRAVLGSDIVECIECRATWTLADWARK